MPGSSVQITIDPASYNRMMALLQPDRYRQRLEATMLDATRHLVKQVQYPPPGPPTRAEGAAANMLKTPKQRRWFFWAWRNGIIDVPYRRGQSPGSQKMGQSWSERVVRRVGAIEGIVKCGATYGKYVMDEKLQAAIHRGRWKTIQGIMRDQEKFIQALFAHAVRMMAAGR